MKRLYLLFTILGTIGSLGAMKSSVEDLNKRLFEVLQKGTTQEVENLLSLGAKVNAHDKSEATPLHWAALYGRSDICELLIKSGAEVDALTRDGRTSLLIVVSRETLNKGRLKVCTVLLENGADVNAQDKNGFTVLHWAARKGYSDILNLLLDKGAKTNSVTIGEFNGWAPLHFATWNGKVEACRLLVMPTFIGGKVNIKASKKRVYTLLGCFKKMKLTKDIKMLLLSYDREMEPFFIFLALSGKNVPKTIINRLKPVIEGRIDLLERAPMPLINCKEVGKLLDREKLEENFGSKITEGIKKAWGFFKEETQEEKCLDSGFTSFDD